MTKMKETTEDDKHVEVNQMTISMDDYKLFRITKPSTCSHAVLCIHFLQLGKFAKVVLSKSALKSKSIQKASIEMNSSSLNPQY